MITQDTVRSIILLCFSDLRWLHLVTTVHFPVGTWICFTLDCPVRWRMMGFFAGNLVLFLETNKGEHYTPRIMWLAQVVDVSVQHVNWNISQGEPWTMREWWNWCKSNSSRCDVEYVWSCVCVCVVFMTTNTKQKQSGTDHVLDYITWKLNIVLISLSV